MSTTANNIILIEGLGGAGKTTTAQLLATRYGFENRNSGTFFRSTAAAMLLASLRSVDAADFVIDASYQFDVADPLQPQFAVNDRDVSELLQSPRVTRAAAVLGSISGVRDHLENLFDASMQPSGPTAIEGKNFGERFTEGIAAHFFLIAEPGIRAQRKYALALQQGRSNYSLLEAYQDIIRNDQRDAKLLVIPAGAQVLDTSRLSPDQVVQTIITTTTQLAAT